MTPEAARRGEHQESRRSREKLPSRARGGRSFDRCVEKLRKAADEEKRRKACRAKEETFQRDFFGG